MKIGYCLTGSFCTFAKSLEALEALVRAGHTITPIMSQTAYTTDTRFGDAVDIQNRQQYYPHDCPGGAGGTKEDV